jgi:hypothetical protein
MSEKNKRYLWIIALLGLGIVTRWIPHPPNFTPILAIALFSGSILSGSWTMIVPILTMFISDLFLGSHDLMWVVYLSLLPMVWMGHLLPMAGSTRERLFPKVLAWTGAGLAGAVFFFVTTNVAVWWYGNMYAHTWEGLLTCFTMAIPFFHNSVLATWAFLGH